MMRRDIIDRLSSRLRLGRKVRVIAPQVTVAQQVKLDALMGKIATTPAAGKVQLTTATGAPRFCWGLYGFPPDDNRPWEMTD